VQARSPGRARPEPGDDERRDESQDVRADGRGHGVGRRDLVHHRFGIRGAVEGAIPRDLVADRRFADLVHAVARRRGQLVDERGVDVCEDEFVARAAQQEAHEAATDVAGPEVHRLSYGHAAFTFDSSA
jgi:hypothetical protein